MLDSGKVWDRRRSGERVLVQVRVKVRGCEDSYNRVALIASKGAKRFGSRREGIGRYEPGSEDCIER